MTERGFLPPPPHTVIQILQFICSMIIIFEYELPIDWVNSLPGFRRRTRLSGLVAGRSQTGQPRHQVL